MAKVYHRTYQEYREGWDRIRSAIRGQDRIHQEGQMHLPKPEGMTTDGYHAYVKRASFYGVAERTLRGMVGATTRTPPILTLPPRLEPMRDAATFEGNSFDVLLEETMAEVLSIGRIALVLDYPQAGATPGSAPFISTFHAENILDWREQLVDGRQRLTMIRLHENNEDLDDGVEQHLVLSLEPAYTVKRFHVTTRRTGAGSITDEVQVDDDLVPQINGSPLWEIPVAIVSPYNLKADTEKPPFLDLVNVNLAHYRNSADYEHALFLTSQPTPWVAGAINEKNKPTQIGSGAFWVLPEGATCGVLEIQGAGIASIKAAMDDKVAQMATLGARMVHDGKGRNETTDTAKLRTRSEMSLLFSSVNMVEAALLKLLRIAADWTQPGTGDQVVLKLHRDFVTAQMDATTLTALIKAWQSGALSHDSLLLNLKRGEMVDPNRSLEEELALIEEEGGLSTANVVPFGITP
jgi:hypothetical protein